MSDYFQENDATHSLHFSVSNDPSFLNYTTSSNMINFQGNVTSVADIDVNFTIRITASDSYEVSSVSFVIEVKENHSPVAPSSNFTLDFLEGQQGSTTITSFTDTESDTITYA